MHEELMQQMLKEISIKDQALTNIRIAIGIYSMGYDQDGGKWALTKIQNIMQTLEMDLKEIGKELRF